MRVSLLFLLLLFSIYTSNSQITLFEDDFESYTDFTIENFGNWVMYDLDETPTWGVPECNFINEGYTGAGIIFNPYQCTEDQMGPFDPEAGNYSTATGEKYLSFWCAIETTNDNYLVSPQIDLSDALNPSLTFFAKSLANATNGFDPERFEVLLSTTGNEVSDFTISLGDVVEMSNCCNWYEYTFALNDYEGEQVYIAIHHISSENTYALHIDDFKVEATSSATITDLKVDPISIYPNPIQDIMNITSESTLLNVKIFDVLGKLVINKNPLTTIYSISLIDLKRGVYFVEITTKIGIKKTKIIKK